MTYDIIIVGNGILGLSTAYHLSKKDPTMKIAIVGPQDRQGAATIAAGAMLNAYAELTNVSLVSDEGRLKFEMARKASQLWSPWIHEINQNLEHKDHVDLNLGTYVINNSLSGKLDCENYDVILNTLKTDGEEFIETSGQNIQGMNPLEGCRPIRSLYIPREGYINSHQLLRALYLSLQNIPHVDFIFDEVTGIKCSKGKVTTVQTKQHPPLSSKNILLAAGAFSQNIINTVPEIKEKIPPIFAGVGVSLLLKQDPTNPVHHVIRTPNRSGACGLHALPRDKETIYIGASNNVYVTPSHQPTAGISHFLLQCAIEQINQNLYKTEILNWQVGNRPVTLDTFPLLGSTSIEGLWMLTGTYRDGFHQAPLLSDELSNMILGKPSDLNPLFRSERRLIKTRTVQESIDEYMSHYLAAAYEHGAHPPRFLQEKGYIIAARNKAERWYELLKTDFGLSPDLMFMFDFAPDQNKLVRVLRNYLSCSVYV